jgi:hypothetical protein
MPDLGVPEFPDFVKFPELFPEFTEVSPEVFLGVVEIVSVFGIFAEFPGWAFRELAETIPDFEGLAGVPKFPKPGFRIPSELAGPGFFVLVELEKGLEGEGEGEWEGERSEGDAGVRRGEEGGTREGGRDEEEFGGDMRKGGRGEGGTRKGRGEVGTIGREVNKGREREAGGKSEEPPEVLTGERAEGLGEGEGEGEGRVVFEEGGGEEGVEAKGRP